MQKKRASVKGTKMPPVHAAYQIANAVYGVECVGYVG